MDRLPDLGFLAFPVWGQPLVGLAALLLTAALANILARRTPIRLIERDFTRYRRPRGVGFRPPGIVSEPTAKDFHRVR